VTISCTKKAQNDKDIEVFNQRKKVSIQQDTSTNILRVIKSLDFLKIKKGFEENSTSTYLDNIQDKVYFRPQEKGFYGKYTFLKYCEEKSAMIQVGKMIIFNNIKPWEYNNTDIFIELTVYTSEITALPDIQVGDNISSLYDCLGEPYRMNDDYICYIYEDIGLLMMFMNVEGKISWFKLGYYKREVLENIDNYIALLLRDE
jgi:hypothetical protein